MLFQVAEDHPWEARATFPDDSDERVIRPLMGAQPRHEILVREVQVLTSRLHITRPVLLVVLELRSQEMKPWTQYIEKILMMDT